MTQLVVGVIGHVDHGKTALVRALTGVETDRLPEEKQRGISIALGFAHLRVAPDCEIDLIDMPGHERFVRTMISGATGIDAVLLVIAANEGIKPQTVEHIDIAALLGLKRALIAISKTDLVSLAQAQRVADDAMQRLTAAGLQALPPVMTSTLQAQGIDRLRDTLRALSADPQQQDNDGLPFLPIDRAFSIAGHGPVVTGTLRGAPLTVGDRLELWPARRSVRVRAVQVRGAAVDSAPPGQRVALNLRDVEIGDLQRGMSLAPADALAASEWLTIAIRAVDSAPALKNGRRLKALLGTAEIDVRLRLLDRDVLEAGQRGYAQLHCATPIALPAGEHVVLRIASPSLSVAGGRILETVTRRLRRNDDAVLARLHDLRTLAPPALIAAEIQRAAGLGSSVQELCRLTALSAARINALLQNLPVASTRSGLVVSQTELDRLLADIPSLLAAHAEGLPRDRLLKQLRDCSQPVMDAALGRLLGRGVIIERGSQLMLPRPDQDRARAQSEDQRRAQIAELLRLSALRPPKPDEIITSVEARRAVERLLRDGVLVRAVDRAKRKEMLFHRDAIRDAQRRLEARLAPPGLLVTEIATALEISRKYAMPLLDHLDAIHFTQRIDERRVRGTAN